MARAVFGNPALLVLDEPNAHLDAEGEQALVQAVVRMRAKGTTVILIAQRAGVMAQVDKMLVLKAGKISAFGPRDEIIERLGQLVSPNASRGFICKGASAEVAATRKDAAGDEVPRVMSARRRDMGVSRSMVFGVVVLVLFLGGFGAWAMLAPLESAAIAKGVLSVSGKRKTVQHLEGGIVGEILIKEGDVVAAGQTLIALDDTRARTSFSRLNGQYRSATALKARLEAERDGSAQVRYPEWLRQAAGEEETDDFVATQDRIFQARARSLDTQRAIYKQQIAQLREEAAGLKEEVEAQNREIALLEEEIAGIRTLVKKGLEGKQRLLAPGAEESADRGRPRAEQGPDCARRPEESARPAC